MILTGSPRDILDPALRAQCLARGGVALPRNPVGKLPKRDLRDLLEAQA